MAIQMLPRLDTGKDTATSLGQGLQTLLQHKMNKMMQAKQQQKTASGLESLLGLSPENAAALAGVPEPLLRAIIPQMQKGIQAQQARESSQEMKGVSTQPDDTAPVATTKAEPVATTKAEPVATTKKAEPSKINEDDAGAQAYDRAYALTGGDVKYAMKAEEDVRKRVRRENAALRKESRSDKQFAFTQSKGYRDDLYKRRRNAVADIQGLKLQRTLVNRGELWGPKEKLFLDIIGDNIGISETGKTALMNTDSQTFEKLSIPYFRGLKDKFGARPTQWDAQQIQKGFPTLYQTDDGKKIIIDLMENESKTHKKEADIAEAIVERNGGVPPLDLRNQTLKELDAWQANEYEKLKRRFEQNLTREENLPTMDPAKVQKGLAYKNKETGVFYVSNGKKWNIVMTEEQVL